MEGLKQDSVCPGEGRGETNLIDSGREVGAMRCVGVVGKRGRGQGLESGLESCGAFSALSFELL